MTKLAGKDREIRIDDAEMANGGGGHKIGGVTDDSYKHLCKLLEVGEYGESYVDRIASKKDKSATVSYNLDPADTGQLLLIPGTTVYLAIFPQGTTAAGTQMKLLVESVGEDSSEGGGQKGSASLSGENSAPAAITAAP